MLAHLIAAGLFTAGAGGISDTGTVIATAERTVTLATVAEAVSFSSDLPMGALAWRQQFDPADHLPFAVNFTALLGSTEKIALIEEIALNATAALLGVSVDASAGYSPIIDTGGKKVQLWFVTSTPNWSNVAFGAGGVLLPVSVRVLTDSTPAKRIERTAILTVRQL